MLQHSSILLTKILYISFLLEETLMWWSTWLKMNLWSHRHIFPKIGALWVQAHILFIFRITTTSGCIRASQHFNQSSKCHKVNLLIL
ncbi:unnamed protein product [Spirodela intermedia]|uniref:Uncharacterized protein n=1 Tax=Spirodela intermedia TaxID=51605 RepID=A0ABN7E8J0_SPIIN|nr:unnamed protein product [Spirodela intermedia]